MFKVKLGIAPVIMNDVFRIRKNDYNTRKADEFHSHCVKKYIMAQKLYLFWALNYGQYFLMNIKVLLI